MNRKAVKFWLNGFYYSAGNFHKPPDAFAFFLCEILTKISHIVSSRGVNVSGSIVTNRRIIEAEQPFEPQSGEILAERTLLFCGKLSQTA